MLKKGQVDLVERHHQLTDGKNLAIQRYRQGKMDQGQDFSPADEEEAKEENESSVMQEADLVTTGLAKKIKSFAVEETEGEEDTSAQHSSSVLVPRPRSKSKHKKIIIIKAKRHLKQS